MVAEGLAVLLPVLANAGGQGLDVSGVIVVMVDEAKLRQEATAQTPGVDRIKNTGRGGGRILRVSRQDEGSVEEAVCDLQLFCP